MLAKLCKSWKRYMGFRPPRCSGGKGCKMCWAIYRRRYRDVIRRRPLGARR